MSSKPVRVHLGVTRALQSELQAGGPDALAQLAKRLDLSRIREDRLAKFGILSADADASVLDRLRAEPGIDFVEQDKKQKAIGKD